MEKRCATCGAAFSKAVNVSRADWRKRLYCSRSCQYAAMRGRPNPKLAYWKGKKQSAESIAKRSVSLRAAHAEGRMHVVDNTGLRREQTSQWKGDDITYRSAHSRLYRERGKPTACELCGRTDGWLEWALKHDARSVKEQTSGAEAGMSFSPDPQDYLGTCRPCHRAYDERERDPVTGRYL